MRLMDWIRSLRKPVEAERSLELERETEEMIAQSRAVIRNAQAIIASSRRADEAIRRYRAGQ